jgi:signal transduction histidine kinase/DNA-binding response OmpR family regulator
LPDFPIFVFNFDDKMYFGTTVEDDFYLYDGNTDKFYPDPDMPLMKFKGDGGGFASIPTTDAEGWLWSDMGSGLFAIKSDGTGQYQVVSSAFKLFQAYDTYDVYSEDGEGGNRIIWLAGPEGVLRYDGPLEEVVQQEYNALVRSIKIQSDSLVYGGYGDLPQNQSFDYISNTVVFSYAAPYFTDEASMQYSTFLQGLENHWSDWNKQSEREYINLPAGAYTFRVKSRNVYGHESTIASYSFSITPPWYASWLAYVVYLVIGLSLIYSFIRWRTGRLHMRSLALELEVENRTEEIQRHVEELSVINTVQEGLVEQMNLKAIYALVGNKIREVFDSQVVVISSFDLETDLAYFHFVYEKGEILEVADPTPIDPFRRQVINSAKALVVNENFSEKAKSYGIKDVIVGEAPKSVVWVPLVVGDKVIGTVSIQNIDHENAFTESDIELLGTLTSSMAVALENVRLFEESKHLLSEVQLQAKELAVINSIQAGLVEQTDTEAIYTLMGEKIRDRFGSQAVVINTFDHNANLNYYRYVYEKGKRLDVTEPVPLNNIMKKLIETNEPVIFNENYAALRKEYGLGEVIVGHQPKSAVWVPITAKDTVMGSISLQDIDRENAFSESDIKLLGALTVSMSIALEKSRLFEEAEQRAAEMSTVNTISQALTKHLELDQLVQLVGENMRDLFNADIAYVALVQKEKSIIEFPYQYGDDLQPINLGEGITSHIIATNKAKLINQGVTKAHKELSILMIGTLPESYLGVPIPVGDEVIGVISVQRTSSKNHFDQSDTHLLETIASNIGIAIHNAQLFKEAEASRAVAEDANEAKSAFLSTVSHELRTPLTSVMGFAKITKRRLEERIFPEIKSTDSKMQRTIKQISDNLNVVVSEGERLTKLINNVLDLAKIEAGRVEWHMENLQVLAVVERAIDATNALFEQKGLVLKRDISPNLPDIKGDEDKLIQVVVNLLSNAVKFTNEGEILCEAEEKDGDVIISVRDSGIGIAKEDLPKVFEKFRQVGDTLTDKPTGTGLGLPISKEIVEYHGGRIWLQSEVGVGSTFFFSLPVSDSGKTTLKTFKLDELVDQLEGNYAKNQFENAAEKTILVIDDEAPIRELLNQELSGIGFNVIEAVDGMEGIEKVRHKHPDLILLDVMMPEMNGYDVAAVLKNDPKTKDIPIIILSVVKDKERGLNIGIDRYLFKPINTDLLFKEIGSLLGQGRSKRKVMILDEDSSTVSTLMGVLQDKGYYVVEANGPDLVQKAILGKPDIIIVNSTLAADQETVKALRLQKGMENVLFLVYE